MIKIVIIIILKPYPGIDPGPNSTHGLGWLLTQVNVRIKMIIIIILKLNLEVNLRQGQGSGSG